MKKNKRIAIAILFVASYLFVSCVKEAALKNSDENVMTAFSRHLTESVNKLPKTHNKSISPMFSNNPYDSAGVIHNQIVDYLYKNNYIGKNFSHLMDGIRLYSGLELSENDFYNLVVDMTKGVYNKDKSYSPNYVNNNLGKISQPEKDILNSYFETISKIRNVDSRIAVSKDMEQFVLDSKDYTADMKERLLTTFSIYRHSSYFWDDKVDLAVLPNPDNIDAVAAERIFPDAYEWNCHDAKDVYRLAGSISATMFQLAVYNPAVFNFIWH